MSQFCNISVTKRTYSDANGGNHMKYALTLALLLGLSVSSHATDENQEKIVIQKDEVQKVIFTKDNSIYFHMKDDSYLKGDIVKPRHCNYSARYKIGFQDEFSSEFKLYHREGFRTCKFTNVERIA